MSRARQNVPDCPEGLDGGSFAVDGSLIKSDVKWRNGVRGRGAVAIWHDMAPERRQAFYAWHGEEHMPERVAIEGFLRGRRFAAIEADREFFNLYETRDAGVVAGAAYRARLENPTPRTLETVRHFRRVARSLCGVVATVGRADGCVLATLRYNVPDATRGEHEAALAALALPALAGLPGVAAVHALAADLEASRFVNAEQRARGSANETPSHSVVVEGWSDEAPFIAMLRERLAGEVLSRADASTGEVGFYRHQVTAFSPS